MLYCNKTTIDIIVLKLADKLYEEFRKLMNSVKKEMQDSGDPYSWQGNDDERSNISDRDILGKSVNLKTHVLLTLERNLTLDMSYKYKDIFSLRDITSICPNIEVDIEIIDNLPFFIRPIMSREKQTYHG